MIGLVAVLLAQLGASGGNLSTTAPTVLLDEGVRQGSVGELNCTGAGITCTRSGARGTLNVTGGGVGGGPPVDAGYVVWGSNSTGSTNERAITSGTNTTVDVGTAGQVRVNLSGTVPQTLGGTGAGALTCTSGQALTSNGTAQACTSTLTASDVACAGTCVADSEISAVSGAKVSGTVASATSATTAGALSANPADCTAGQYATTISASGDLTCAQVATSQLSGTLGVSAGGTNLTAADEDATLVGNGTTWQAKTLPSCSNATTSKLLYDNSTNTWSCGTDQTGGGGGTSPLILTFGGF